MSWETLAMLNQLARLLLDARATAGNLLMVARRDGLDVRDYDLIDDLAALRERVSILLERTEEKR